MEREDNDGSETGGESGGEENAAAPVATAAAGGYVCATCGAKFARRYNRDRHVQLTHNNIVQVYDCSFCGAFFNTLVKLREHRDSHKPTTGFEEKSSAFRKKCVIFRKTYGEKMLTLENAFNDDEADMKKLIEYEVGVRRSMKLGIIYHIEFMRIQPQMGGAAEEQPPPPPASENETLLAGEEGEEEEEEEEAEEEEEEEEEGGDGERDDEEEREISLAGNVNEEVYEICLRAPSAVVTAATNVRQAMRAARQYIQTRVEDFIENGSGWRVSSVVAADVEIGNCSALNGACNLVSITYLKSLQSTRRSKDMQKCFLFACAYHFTKSDNSKIINKFINKHFVVNIASPVMVKDVSRFERDNSHLGIKINVIYLEDKQLFPLIYSKKADATNHITLLLHKTEAAGKVVNHYSYVRDHNKMLRKNYVKNDQYSYGKTLSCLNCFAKFVDSHNGADNLRRHYEHCSKNKPQAVKVPEEGDVIQFTHHNNKFESYFIGFFDFESKHVRQKYECNKCLKVREEDDTVCTHQTLVKAVQEPITYSYLILDRNEKIVFQNTYTGLDCVQKFLAELISIEPELLAVLNRNELLNMGVGDERRFKTAVQCHICETDLDNDRVRDHCHITGNYLGAAHTLCNLERVEEKSIPMFCHNLTSYGE